MLRHNAPNPPWSGPSQPAGTAVGGGGGTAVGTWGAAVRVGTWGAAVRIGAGGAPDPVVGITVLVDGATAFVVG